MGKLYDVMRNAFWLSSGVMIGTYIVSYLDRISTFISVTTSLIMCQLKLAKGI